MDRGVVIMSVVQVSSQAQGADSDRLGTPKLGWTLDELATAGRSVPLTSRICAVLTLWLSRFLEAEADSYVFPRFSVGLEGNARRPKIYAADLAHPIGEWKKAWKVAC